jgi:hypothetical protein
MEKTSYTVTLSNAEDLALSYIAFSQQEWIDNAIHERCRLAIDDIVHLTVEKCLTENIQLPNSKDAMVELAFEQGWITAAANRG